ncbi:hypothetical protein NST07_33890 [Paenibacillus sp. FSL L8-0340]|uniref:hypothetical protein n=1 Tax=Paenibacillus sp. FSL L8-0340 TaxID=2954685 RepID=UPI0031589751
MVLAIYNGEIETNSGSGQIMAYINARTADSAIGVFRVQSVMVKSISLIMPRLTLVVIFRILKIWLLEHKEYLFSGVGLIDQRNNQFCMLVNRGNDFRIIILASNGKLMLRLYPFVKLAGAATVLSNVSTGTG